MQKIATDIHGAWIIEPDVFEDHRGVFFESYHRDKFAELGITDVFVQDNHSRSVEGVLRGLHFQYPPHEMSKLVRCTRGKLYDVVVDMRASSPTFKKWIGVELSKSNRRMLYIPTGCAHGFLALTDCELLYKCGAVFHKPSDGNFAYNDSEIGVVWPLEGREPILSERDVAAPSFADVIGRAQFGV
ncbi:MAG: dTDP-4-dehydrorhamnose 3,5-epimerase [Patescibacteria group bacterium]